MRATMHAMRRRLAIALLVLAGCGRKSAPGADAAETSLDAASPDATSLEPVLSAEDQDHVTVRATMNAVSLADALRAAKPIFKREDEASNTNSTWTGALAVGYWASKKMKWADVTTAKDETSWAMAQKDIEDARGKRLCPSGTVDQIKAIKGLDDTKLFIGTLATSDGPFEAFAVGSTGALVHGSRARYCGVVTGLSQLTTEQGAVHRYVNLIGMYDLPENRAH